MYYKILKHCFQNQNISCKRFKFNWIQPSGYDTNIKVYNCIIKDKVPLIVKNKDRVSWYTCGPTVYDSAHIGHASCYVKLDILQRILREYFKLNLTTVMNITDIDDKIIKRSLTLNVSPSELARKYENEFWMDCTDLNIATPDVIVRVTDHMPIISQFIHKILNKNKAYTASDGSVYFDLSKCKNIYGKLVPIITEESKDGVKKSVGDFVVWKSSKINEPSWETNLGVGRPGWHSECSALASAVFGEELDIHAGGIDLRFPHHENEEAISCAHHDKDQWVNYWLHTGQLNLTGDETKMSKSLGNCVFIRDLLNEKKFAGDVFRMACVMSHYRANMEYNNELLNTAESQLNKFTKFLSDCNDYTARILPPGNISTDELNTRIIETTKEIDIALKNDFNTAQTIKAVFKLISVTNKMIHSKNTNCSLTDLSDCAIISSVGNFVREQLKMLGFTSNITGKDLNTVDEDRTASILDVLISFRQNVRNIGLENKNPELLKYCDRLRDELKMYGVEIKDRGKISSWSKV